MSLLTITSPHAHKPGDTGSMMRMVVFATFPGLAALTYFFGWGSVINVLLACLVAITAESFVLVLRKRPILFYLKDYSAIVTAVLLGLALPPFAPWWLTFIGVAFAIIFAKHLYGGMGYNPFNPAMVGYIVLLISFPVEMTSWLPPKGVEGTQAGLSLLNSINTVFNLPFNNAIDAYTMATPLDAFKFKGELTTEQALQSIPVFDQLWGQLSGKGWQWVSIAYLAGGLFLLYKRIITWHIPVGLIGSLFVMSFIFHNIDSEHYATPMLHVLGGATMLGAFFIATDPVSAATSNLGRFLYGTGIGVITYIIRVWGNYPDAIAFGVLLMNFAAPFLDYYTKPRTYGHTSANRGIHKKG